MPEISRFLGIIIYMYFNEHNPPHFHVKYNECNAIIEIGNFAVLDGYLPSKVLSLVVEWASMHQKELFKNWETLQETGDFFKIEPLVYTPRISSFGEAHDSEADAVYMGVNEEAERGVQRSPKLERRGVIKGAIL